MFDLLMICLAVFVMTFISDQDIPVVEIEKATQVCSAQGGLKALNASKFFNKRIYSAQCANGTIISGGA